MTERRSIKACLPCNTFLLSLSITLIPGIRAIESETKHWPSRGVFPIKTSLICFAYSKKPSDSCHQLTAPSATRGQKLGHRDKSSKNLRAGLFTKKTKKTLNVFLAIKLSFNFKNP